jgi:hypothetical protein
MAEVSASLQELVNDPVSHLCVVGGYRNKGRLYQVGSDVYQGGEEVEALLDFLDGLLLVCDYLENALKVPRADDREDLKGSLLLLLLNVGQEISYFGEIKAEERDVVDSEGGLLGELGCEGAVFEAGQDMASHAELDELDLEVLQALQLLSD